jgi:two-component system cell cycle sensor histidine kinase/response regulator CckA
MLIFFRYSYALITDGNIYVFARLGKYESLCILAANHAHDFNNLLTIISGNLTLLKINMQGKDPRMEKWIDQAQESTIQAFKLAQQMISIVRQECAVKKVCSIKELLRSSGITVLHTSAVNGIFNIDEELWKVYVDEGQINQVILNLVMNAVQATPENGAVWIEAFNVEIGPDSIEKCKPGKYVNISIRDKGIGIPEEYQHNLFEPFFTTKKRGTGLGLSSSYTIIKSHNGYKHLFCTRVIGSQLT